MSSSSGVRLARPVGAASALRPQDGSSRFSIAFGTSLGTLAEGMLSVVMPLYNEGNRIAGALQRTCKALATLGPCEIIAVDDGSLDHSLQELEHSRSTISNLRIIHQPHSGKGEALRQGTRAAKGEFVIFLDADLDLPPEQILFFIAVQKSKAADAVIGSKMHPESTVAYPLRRRLYSWAYYLLVKFLFGLPIRDTQTGLKLVRRDLLLAALEKTQVKGFAFDLELLVRLVQLKARMVEAPVVVHYRMKFGGVGFKTAWSILRETLQTWQRLRAERKAEENTKDKKLS